MSSVQIYAVVMVHVRQTENVHVMIDGMETTVLLIFVGIIALIMASVTARVIVFANLTLLENYVTLI